MTFLAIIDQIINNQEIQIQRLQNELKLANNTIIELKEKISNKDSKK